MLGSSIFMLILFAPFVLQMFYQEKEFFKHELRLPAPFPGKPHTVRDIFKWPGRCEKYLNDHLGGRSFLIKSNNFLRLKIGESGSDMLVMGKNNWLFLKKANDIMNKHRGIVRFTNRQINTWMNEIYRRDRELKQKGSICT